MYVRSDRIVKGAWAAAMWHALPLLIESRVSDSPSAHLLVAAVALYVSSWIAGADGILLAPAAVALPAAAGWAGGAFSFWLRVGEGSAGAMCRSLSLPQEAARGDVVCAGVWASVWFLSTSYALPLVTGWARPLWARAEGASARLRGGEAAQSRSRPKAKAKPPAAVQAGGPKSGAPPGGPAAVEGQGCGCCFYPHPKPSKGQQK